MFNVLFGIAYCCTIALGAVIDQRQTGGYNIRLTIKDVTIIAIHNPSLIDDSFNDVQHANDDAVYEDYDYNLEQLTINPSGGLFGKPSTKPPSTEAPILTTNKPTVHNIQEIIAIQTTKKPVELQAVTESSTLPSTTASSLVIIQENTSEKIVLEVKQNDTVSKVPVNIPKPNYNIQQHIPVQVVMEPISIPKRRNNNKQTNVKRFPKRPTIEVVSSDSLKEVQPVIDAVECPNGKSRDTNRRCRRVRKSDGVTQLIKLLMSNQQHELTN